MTTGKPISSAIRRASSAERAMPLSGCLGYQKHLGRTGGYRLMIGDAYAFKQSIVQTIEHALAQIDTNHVDASAHQRQRDTPAASSVFQDWSADLLGEIDEVADVVLAGLERRLVEADVFVVLVAQ